MKEWPTMKLEGCRGRVDDGGTTTRVRSLRRDVGAITTSWWRWNNGDHGGEGRRRCCSRHRRGLAVVLQPVQRRSDRAATNTVAWVSRVEWWCRQAARLKLMAEMMLEDLGYSGGVDLVGAKEDVVNLGR